MKSTLVCTLVTIGLLACNSTSQNTASKLSKPKAAETVAVDTPPRPVQPDDRTARGYSTAIAEYIKAANKDKALPDTLFIGKHVEFPDIVLPAVIAGHPIRLTDFEEYNQLEAREDRIYLNIFSWFSADNVEFLIVRFNGSGSPQNNCRMNFSYNKPNQEFVLSELSFDNPYGKARLDKSQGAR